MLRIDWPKVKALSVDGGLSPTDSALFILPVAGRDLLMAIMERYEWEATFRVPNYDYSDWDELQAIVAQTENGLMGTELMSEISGQLERIADALEACCTIPALEQIALEISELELSPIVNVSVSGGGSGGCCMVDKKWLLPESWQDNHPEPEPDSDTPTGESNGDLCDAAHSAHHEMTQWISLFAENVGAASPYTDLWNSISASTLFEASAAKWYAMLSTFASVFYDDLTEDSLAYFESIKQDFICAVIEQGNSVDMRAWLFEKLREAEQWHVGFWLETLFTGTHFNSIYDGSYVPFPEFIGSDCSMCFPTPEFPTGEYYETVIPLDEWVTHQNVANGVGGYTAQTAEYSAASGEWNGSFLKVDIDDVLASVPSGVRVDGYMIKPISGNGVDGAFDMLDLPVNMPMTGAHDGETWLYYNSSFTADFADIAAQCDQSYPYGAAPINPAAAVTILQAVSRYSPKAYTYKIAFLVRLP